jgi:hypothetical protein
MPFCPNCQDEFQDWVKECPDCRVELVDQLQSGVSKSEGTQQRLVTVADYQFPSLAYLSKAKLESEGIQSFVIDEHIINANWLYLIAIGGVKLKVAESDASDAVRILQEVRDFVPGLVEQLEEGCPRCRSSFIRYETFHIRPTYIIMAISALFLAPDHAFSFFFLKRKWRCKHCGYEWK